MLTKSPCLEFMSVCGEESGSPSWARPAAAAALLGQRNAAAGRQEAQHGVFGAREDAPIRQRCGGWSRDSGARSCAVCSQGSPGQPAAGGALPAVLTAVL